MKNKRHPLRREVQIASINARIAQLRSDVKALEQWRKILLRSAEAEHEEST